MIYNNPGPIIIPPGAIPPLGRNLPGFLNKLRETHQLDLFIEKFAKASRTALDLEISHEREINRAHLKELQRQAAERKEQQFVLIQKIALKSLNPER
jgi:hypothetical protein